HRSRDIPRYRLFSRVSHSIFCRPRRPLVLWFAYISSGTMRLNRLMLAMREQLTIEVLEALVGFDTTSRNSNLALVEWVEVYLDRFGVAHERVPDKTGGKANVWATIGPSGVPGTILSGHTDVVPVEGQSWSNDPFRLTVRGKTCHSSLAPHGVNAVEYAARLIVKIRDISNRLARSGARDPLYDVPYTTAHTGVVRGGTALNIVPDACTFEFEFRL